MKEISKRVKYFIIIIVVLLVAVISISFAYWRSSAKESSTNIITTISCLDTTIADVTANLNLSEEFPMSDMDGMNMNPYTFTLTNNCSSNINISISFERLTASTLDSNYVKECINYTGDYTNNSVILSTLSSGTALNGGSAYIIKSDSLNVGVSKSYDFRMWVDELTTSVQAAGKTFIGKIIITNTPKQTS
jgi:uncharacterized membrane protein